jgi:hypothetical protein
MIDESIVKNQHIYTIYNTYLLSTPYGEKHRWKSYLINTKSTTKIRRMITNSSTCWDISYHDQDNSNDEIYVHISARINPTTTTTLMMRCVQISAMISPTVTTTIKMVRGMFRHRLGYFPPWPQQ